jgi:hypothetical protein
VIVIFWLIATVGIPYLVSSFTDTMRDNLPSPTADSMTREAAWEAVHGALPARSTVGPPTFDPGGPHWSVMPDARILAVAASIRRPSQARARARRPRCAT